ncbi:general secretion pathway protein GspK [Candidatus Methylocalor cossyra]|uniref:General secretion pathway protein K n=1 Tax=Candidatus Methylocalor cossyra TaxID=3108543 RepID=A0ABM9NKN9_9GAMM
MASPPPLRQAGLALVLVLWVLALMTIMAGSYSLSTQREAALLSHAHERARGVALAEGGIHYAMLMLSLPDIQKRWRADGTEYLWEVEGARVRIRIFDESGKIDLNAAQEPTLRTVIQRLVHDEDKAAALADAILDWRDSDDLKRMHGAEAEEYRAAGALQKPQNRNFLVLEELRGVLGVTPELYRALAPWFTLYTGQDGLNPAKAPREILLTLTQGDESTVDNFIQQRQLGILQPFPPVPGVQFHAAGDLAYTVLATAEFPGQGGATVSAAVKRGRGADGAPFTYLNFRSRAVPPRRGE